MQPVGLYEKTKAESDAIVVTAAKKRAFSYSILRPSNIFGENMVNKSLFQLIDMINRGLFFYIGKRGASANYIHVDNVVQALMQCGYDADADGQVFNLSDNTTIEDFVAIIAAALGRPAPSVRLPAGFVRGVASLFRVIPEFPLTLSRIDALTTRSVYSVEKIERELAYRHLVTMEKGLHRLAEHWQKVAMGTNRI